MSTVQEVKAEETDFNADTYKTSAYWLNRFEEIFHTLYVGADKQIVTDDEYIIPLVKGSELPSDMEAVESAILNSLTPAEYAEFTSDHALTVQQLNTHAINDVDTWQLKINVVYRKDIDKANGTPEEVCEAKDALEKAANEAAVTADNMGLLESGKGLYKDIKQALDLTDSADIAANLKELEEADQLPAIETPTKDDDGNYVLTSINDNVEEAYTKALTNLYSGVYSNNFTATVVDDDNSGDYPNVAKAFVEDNVWHGWIVIKNKDENGKLAEAGIIDQKEIALEIELSQFDNGEQAIADAIKNALESEPVYMPYAKSFLVGNGYNAAVEAMLVGKAYAMLDYKYPDVHDKVEVEVVNFGKLTKTGEHSAILSGSSIKFREADWDYYKTIELGDITVEEDVVDGIDLYDAAGNLLTEATVKDEFEIGGNGLSDSNISYATIRSSHDEMWQNILDALEIHDAGLAEDLYSYIRIPYAMFESGLNLLFTVDDGGFNVNKLGAYTYTLTSNDTRTPVDGNISYTYNVVKTIRDLEGDVYAAATSSDTSVATITTAGTITAYTAGTTTITLTNTEGKSVQYTLTVDERGNYTLDQEKANENLVIANNAAEIGFVYHAGTKNYSYKVTEQLVDAAVESSDKVIDFTYDEENNAFVIKPLAAGSATVEIKGGKYGKLLTTLKISVDRFNGVTIDETTINVKAYRLNDAAISTIQNTPIYQNEYVNVDTFDFSDDDMLLISVDDDTFNVQDAVPASDLQAIYIDTVHHRADQDVIPYYGNEDIDYDQSKTFQAKVLGKVSLGIAELGLVPESIEVIEGDIEDADNDQVTTEYASFEIIDGALVIKSTGIYDTDGINTLKVIDEFGNEATVKVTASKDATDPYDVVVDAVAFDITDNEVKGLTVPEKTSYFIGEKLDVTGGAINFNNTSSIPLRDYMITGFDSSKVNQEQTLSVAYGSCTDLLNYTVRIKARVENVSLSSLGLEAGDIKTVSTTGDKEVTAKLDGDSIEISAMAINQNSAAIIETTSGNKLAIRVNVDENGEISTEVVKTFKSSSVNIANNEDTLRILATAVSSDNLDVATAKISKGNIVITSVAPGTATITAADGDKEAKIAVVVDEFGNIETTITKYNADGWKKVGDTDWAYYRDGEMVVSDWVCVQEADPYNNNEVGDVWYHFGKDGLMQRGWIVDETGWKIYLLDSNGRMMHSQWVNAPAQESLNRPAGIYRLTDDGAVQMNGWAESVTPGIYWFCNAGNGLFEQDNPASWGSEKLF